MYTYIVDVLDEKKHLGWNSDMYPRGSRDQRLREIMFMNGRQAGLEYHAYFLFKFAYDKEKRYAFEKLENYTDFSEFVPITPI